MAPMHKVLPQMPGLQLVARSISSDSRGISGRLQDPGFRPGCSFSERCESSLSHHSGMKYVATNHHLAQEKIQLTAVHFGELQARRGLSSVESDDRLGTFPSISLGIPWGWDGTPLRMYSFGEGEQHDGNPSHWPPELAAQKRPVVHVYEVSDGEGEEPPKSRRRASQEDGANPAFGAALGRLILGEEVELNEALEEARRSMGSTPMPEPGISLSSEVARIRAAAVDDYREILGLSQQGDLEVSQVQSRYRQIMRLLHPDKRDASMSAAALAACDEAMERVQQALQGLKKEIEVGPDPSFVARQSMRRMQELQRLRAQQARQRQEEQQMGMLLKDLDQVQPDVRLGPGPSSSPKEDDATNQILQLLASQLSR
eukprot:s800_g27.t1